MNYKCPKCGSTLGHIHAFAFEQYICTNIECDHEEDRQPRGKCKLTEAKKVKVSCGGGSSKKGTCHVCKREDVVIRYRGVCVRDTIRYKRCAKEMNINSIDEWAQLGAMTVTELKKCRPDLIKEKP